MSPRHLYIVKSTSLTVYPILCIITRIIVIWVLLEILYRVKNLTVSDNDISNKKCMSLSEDFKLKYYLVVNICLIKSTAKRKSVSCKIISLSN